MVGDPSRNKLIVYLLPDACLPAFGRSGPRSLAVCWAKAVREDKRGLYMAVPGFRSTQNQVSCGRHDLDNLYGTLR